ncbi:lycopene cyclase family protein [Pedobacter glucosidilyticus]|nr:lycopene cyclase family protein [Pedobacter glucosidilyticus]KHJ36783.1 lycopene cyclase family protein [Pedobacter glucosidilyticus]
MQKPNPFYNYTIIGAGASGLWMAYALYKHGLLKDKTLVIVEQDTQKFNDRTWCYWAKEELSPQQLADKVWHYSLNAEATSKSGSIFPYSYYHIRSKDFYQKIKNLLVRCENISWLYTSFKSYEDATDVMVKTKQASWKTSKLFLSALTDGEDAFSSQQLKSYLNNSDKQHILMWQSFVGWRVKTLKPVFNSSRMTLMDFDIPQNGQTQFLYELPFSDTESLVEITRFGEEKLNPTAAEALLKDYLAARNTPYEITETEVGAIPMTTHFDSKRKTLHKNENIIFLGTLAGAIKPTTGYGFKRMAKYADDVAKAMATHAALPTTYRPWRFRLYDTILLQILVSQPQRGKEIFQTLFKKQPTPRILKFLDEETSIKEEVMIFSKLPILLFLKSLIRYFTK